MERQSSGSSVFQRKQYYPSERTSSHSLPQAPMYEAESESKSIIPAQNGFNPCGFAACLCNGTCTLRIGCYVVGAIIIVFNLLNALYIYVINNHLVGLASSTSHADSLNEFLLKKYPVDVLDWIFALLFGVVPGVVLIVAAAMLLKIACLLCICTMVVGILSHIIDIIITTKIIAEYPVKDEASRKVVTATHASKWMIFILRTGLYGFCILCALALQRQIVNEVYPRKRPGNPAQVKVFTNENAGDGHPENVAEEESPVYPEKESS